uniref:Nitric oxide reductase subunit B n=1 Tax=Chryseobacterium balustinum TaxID=246 RepID=A0AAX2IKZ3_9FLAO|nr:cbb3-type cytochrome c oxidase subunit I [Chryseobacterium balustinum]AZB29645.1 cbb3-type cytochrome c oxidase subunit I [Chryseobacterium balustinum]SKB92752.1 nitric oxide reductase subunit B [Chryseobacterium balustinum]SQA89994.1 Nitric oxide reductase subunit B [Chryseobacterium balustinum]
MKNSTYPLYYILVGLLSLALCLLVGLLSGVQYVIPDFIKENLPFTVLRPLHTLFALSWIFMAAMGGIFWYIQNDKVNPVIMKWQFWIFFITGILIVISYLFKKFEGKEYLEFPHWFYIPILLGWLLFGLYYFRVMWRNFSQWPVYYWMWGTGILLMIFHFTEAHLWILPYFRENYIQNLTMQWKSGGAYVGAWNMLVYGSSMYIMEKSSENDFYSRSKTAFFFFFLGLINVMFNWAHHVYAVPNPGWIRYAAYLVSMTEWIILLRIIYLWKKNLSNEKKIFYSSSYSFMILSELWIFINLFLAILLSIPALNLFTHGTHITVAHSMGTIIGINTTILLSSICFILDKIKAISNNTKRYIVIGTKIFNLSFICFFITLLVMGVERSKWIYFSENILFSQFYDGNKHLHILFGIFGLGLLLGMYIIIYQLIKLIIHIILKKVALDYNELV